MNFKMTGLLALFLGMTAASYSVTVRSSKTTPQFQRTASQRPVRPFGTPRLTDLYSVTWEEIPMPDSTPLDPHVITADSITNDGTIAGRGTGALVLWHPDTQAWEEVPKHHNALPMLISPDGASVVTTDASQSPEPTKILAWNRASGWQALTGRTVTQSQAYNVSRNFRFVVGAGNNIGETAQAWVWALDGGIQQMLPNPEWSGGAGALAVSDDGNVAVGVAIRAPLPGEIWPNRLAVRWVNGGPPAMLRAPDGSELSAAVACNADCSMVFGSNGWFLKNNGEFGFLFWSLEGIPDAYPDPYGAYSVGDASSDGSVVVGLYSANMYPTNPDSESYVERPFIWTQTTGMVSLRSLRIWDEDWNHISTVRISPDGQRILISGKHVAPANLWAYDRVAILHLTPRTARPAVGHSTHARPVPARADQNGPLRIGPRPMDQ